MKSRHLVAACLAVIPFLVAPGRIQPDTKTDLTVSPWSYLIRGLGAWNDHNGLGELQNQAYGYLFPLGPVMGLGELLGLPAWGVQRLWWAIILVVAFLGAERLIRTFAPVGPAAAIAGGLVYALAPRVITVLSQISVEAWPGALAPWLVLAAVPLSRADRTRRQGLNAVALTALLTAALGGVNATASAAALVPAALFLATARSGRLVNLSWWLGAVVAGSLWWLLPLFVLGRYAYPFMDYIETASLTTAVTSVPNVLRGTSHWVAYLLDSQDHPVWQAGWVEAQFVLAILATGAVAGLCIAGLVKMRRVPGTGHAVRWALASVLVAVVLMGLGYASLVGSVVAEPVRDFLDGVGSPLRNVHKLDPVLRLPMALGMAVALDSLRARKLALAGAALTIAASPLALWVGRVGDPGAYRAIPETWTAMAAQVDADAAERGGSTLILPSARDARFVWGTTTDEPLGALASSPVVYRASAPLNNPGATRILDTADLLASSGDVQDSLAAGLARMGIARVVVRHDLAVTGEVESADLVEQTLARSDGFTLVDRVGDLSLWQVDGRAQAITAYPLDSALRVDGGPEAVFALNPHPSTWLELQPGSTQDANVVTDTLRWRAFNSGVPPQFAYSPTLSAEDTAPTVIGARDLPPAGDLAEQPHRVWLGGRVTVSSSAADPFAETYTSPQAGPASAVDGDPTTAWISDTGGPAWLRVDFDTPTVPGMVTLTLADGDHRPSRVSIDGTQMAIGDGVATMQIDQSVDAVDIELSGATDMNGIGIAELAFSGAPVTSAIAIDGSVSADSPVLITRDARAGVGRPGEEGHILRRQVTFGSESTRSVSGRATSANGEPATAPCGQAGDLTIGQTVVALQAVNGDLSSCSGSVAIGPGTQTIVVRDGPDVRVSEILLGSTVTTSLTNDAPRSIRSSRIDSSNYKVSVSAGDTNVIAMTQGASPGWQATLDGTPLESVTVDGWRQGFVVPASPEGTIRIWFEPTRWHRYGLLLGAAAVLGAIVLAITTRGRAAAGIEPEEFTGNRTLSRILPIVVAGLVAGASGVAVALAALFVPQRWVAAAAGGLVAGSAVALAALGVVEASSVGAIAGQILAVAGLAVMTRAMTDDSSPNAEQAPRQTST